MPLDPLVMARQQPLNTGVAQQAQRHLLVAVERIGQAVDERSDAACAPGRRVGEAREGAIVKG